MGFIFGIFIVFVLISAVYSISKGKTSSRSSDAGFYSSDFSSPTILTDFNSSDTSGCGCSGDSGCSSDSGSSCDCGCDGGGGCD